MKKSMRKFLKKFFKKMESHSTCSLFPVPSSPFPFNQGFTLIEIMVATMLLSMLVTILTMIFNQSSIAWSTGVASVTALGNTREEISVYARESENVILDDRGSTVLGVRSVWDFRNDGQWVQPNERSDNAWRTLRSYSNFDEKFRQQSIGASDIRDPLVDKTIYIGGGTAAGRNSFLVGVHSYGPDGKTGGDNSWDDISTMPEEIVK